MAIKWILITLFWVASPMAALHGQGQRIATIDSERILDRMPEVAGIDQRLQLLSETWQEEIGQMDREIEGLEEEFAAREVLYTDEMRQARVSHIESLRQRREAYLREKFGPDGEYFRRQQELLEPLQRQVFNAVQQVALRQGFDFIIDRAQDTRFLYADPEWDVTDSVMREMGLEEEGVSR